MLSPALFFLVAGSADASLIVRRPLEPRQVAALLGRAEMLAGLAAHGVCADFPRRAELDRLNAARSRLSSLLQRDYGLKPSHDMILIDDSSDDCEGYTDFPKQTERYRLLLLRAVAALGMED